MKLSVLTSEASLGSVNRRAGEDTVLGLVNLGPVGADARLRIHASGKREDGTQRKRRGSRHGYRGRSARGWNKETKANGKIGCNSSRLDQIQTDGCGRWDIYLIPTARDHSKSNSLSGPLNLAHMAKRRKGSHRRGRSLRFQGATEVIFASPHPPASPIEQRLPGFGDFLPGHDGGGFDFRERERGARGSVCGERGR